MLILIMDFPGVSEVENPPAMQVQSPGGGDPLEKEMQPTPAQRISWTEETGGLQSMGLQRVRHDLVIKQQKNQ